VISNTRVRNFSVSDVLIHILSVRDGKVIGMMLIVCSRICEGTVR
jgi:hypothetical protein